MFRTVRVQCQMSNVSDSTCTMSNVKCFVQLVYNVKCQMFWTVSVQCEMFWTVSVQCQMFRTVSVESQMHNLLHFFQLCLNVCMRKKLQLALMFVPTKVSAASGGGPQKNSALLSNVALIFNFDNFISAMWLLLRFDLFV